MPIYENGRSIPRIGGGHSRASRVVVILQAAVDESGTHDSSEHYVLGGYVASEDQWAKFEPAWDAMLSRVGVTYFHGTELKSGKKRCAGLPARLRAALAENAEDIANHYLGFRFAIWLRKLISDKSISDFVPQNVMMAYMDFCLGRYFRQYRC